MAISPDYATPDDCREAVKRTFKIVRENVVRASADAGSLEVHIFHDTGMGAANSGQVDHRGSIDWQPQQSATFQHGGNSNRIASIFICRRSFNPCRNKQRNYHERYCLNVWAWGSEADLKLADILSFLSQIPTGQGLNPHQE